MSEDIGAKVERLACGILDELLTPGNTVALADRIDALKVVLPLHIAMLRQKKGEKDADDATLTLPEMRARLLATGGVSEANLVAGAKRRVNGERRSRNHDGSFAEE